MIDSFSSLRERIVKAELSMVQYCEDLFKKIGSQSNLNIFLETFEESALAKAKEVDVKLRKGEAGKLGGMIISIKDNICYQGHKVSSSSRILENFESLFSSTVVERLLAEDAIIIGRTNCDEFAMGSSNENSYFGPVKNPLDISKTPGGSSGGAAASVAAGFCHVALGSDTGGSIRQPASFTGTIGLKPTYGRVSRHGLVAYGSSLDQIGPIANHIEDIALVMEVMAGKDEYDSTVSAKKVDSYTDLKKSKPAYKLAFLDCHYSHEGLSDDVRKASLELFDKLRKEGHTVEEVSFDLMEQLVPVYQVISTAEASSNLARYDGIHFGYRSQEATDLYTTYARSRTEGFGREVKRRIMLGTYVLSEGYYDAYFGKAQKVRNLVKKRTEDILSDYDLIISPTTPHSAFPLGSQTEDPIKMYLEDIYTVQANLAGVPSISIPLAESSGMPFGIQLMGRSFEEKELLAFSKELINIISFKNRTV